MKSTRKQRWGSLLLAVVAASLAVTTSSASPVGDVQQRERACEGALTWLFGCPVNRLGVAEGAEDVGVQEGRRRKDSSTKTGSKNKNTKRVESGGGGSGGGSGGGGGGYYGKPPKPTQPTTKKPGPGHATTYPPLTGKPINVGGQYVGGYDHHHPTTSAPTTSAYSWFNPLGYLPSLPFPSWSISSSSSFDASLGTNQHPGGYATTTHPTTTHEDDYHYRRPNTSKSEVMVLQFPAFVRTIGQGLRNINNALQDVSEQIGDNLYNNLNINNVANGVGNGVAAIFPLEDPQNPDPYNGFYQTPIPVPPPLPFPNFPTFPPFSIPTIPPFPTLPTLAPITFPPLPAVPIINFNPQPINVNPVAGSVSHNSEFSVSNSGSFNVGSNTAGNTRRRVSSRDAEGGAGGSSAKNN